MMVRDKVKVLLVEDDMDFAFLLKKMILADENLDIVAHAVSRASGVEQTKQHRPHIVLMDLNLLGSGLDGIEAAKDIRLTTDAKVLLLTSYEQPEIIINASKRAFASGYVFKSQCQMLTHIIYETAISHTSQEQFIKELVLQELSPAERGVLNDLIEGNIDTLSQSSLKTIANQKTSIFKKLGLKNTGELYRVFRNW